MLNNVHLLRILSVDSSAAKYRVRVSNGNRSQTFLDSLPPLIIYQSVHIVASLYYQQFVIYYLISRVNSS